MAKLNIRKRRPGEMPTAQEWNQLVATVESLINATGQNMFIDSTGVHTRRTKKKTIKKSLETITDIYKIIKVLSHKIKILNADDIDIPPYSVVEIERADWYTFSGSKWDSGTYYVVGQQCEYKGVFYGCIKAHTNKEPPNSTYWAIRDLDLVFYVKRPTSDFLPSYKLAITGEKTTKLYEDWNSTTAYEEGDIVAYDPGEGTGYYICIKANTGHIPIDTEYWLFYSLEPPFDYAYIDGTRRVATSFNSGDIDVDFVMGATKDSFDVQINPLGGFVVRDYIEEDCVWVDFVPSKEGETLIAQIDSGGPTASKNLTCKLQAYKSGFGFIDVGSDITVECEKFHNGSNDLNGNVLPKFTGDEYIQIFTFRESDGTLHWYPNFRFKDDVISGVRRAQITSVGSTTVQAKPYDVDGNLEASAVTVYFSIIGSVNLNQTIARLSVGVDIFISKLPHTEGDRWYCLFVAQGIDEDTVYISSDILKSKVGMTESEVKALFDACT